jgi:hypothetical protein
MINERPRSIRRRMLNSAALFAVQHPGRRQRETVMSSAMTAIGLAVGGSSLLYLLMTRLRNGKGGRRSSPDSSGSDSGYYAGGDGWSLSSWFVSGDSGSGNSCGSSDGGDSGGGDSGGGGGGGGGD